MVNFQLKHTRVYKPGLEPYTIGAKINPKDREAPIETDHCACNPEQGEDKGICRIIKPPVR